MEETQEVPKTVEEVELRVNTRSLGLHDLYKAAFSQENDTDFEPTLKTTTQIYQTDNIDDKNDKNDEHDNSYQLYTFKNLPVCTIELDKTNDVSFNNTEYSIQEISIAQDHMYNDKAPIILHGSFVGNDTVLDLDKGIPIHVVKVSDDNTCTSTTELVDSYNNRNYQGDTQILQRYLNDTAFHRTDEPDDNFDYFLIKKDFDSQKDVGVNPEQIGVKFEDCDFNSSDSFASTESIIPKNIQCPKCPKKFMFKSDLMKHDKHKHTFKQKLNCKYCSKEFASQQNLLFHEKSHKKKNHNKCENCKKTFKKPGFLVKHMIKKHCKTLTFNCLMCNKILPSDALLKIHYKKYHQQQPQIQQQQLQEQYKCEYCGKVFDKKQGLVCHERLHNNSDTSSQQQQQQQHICDYCGKLFLKVCHLKNHLKSHCASKDDNSYVCKVCNKTFKTENTLTEHYRKHTGEKPYKCNTCNKSFAYKSYFKIHERKHSEVKPYVCEYCDKKFITSTDLTKHIRCHTQERPYTCTNCNQCFTQQSNLITHWKKQRCGLKVQEGSTQTNDFELQQVDDKILATNCVNINYNTLQQHQQQQHNQPTFNNQQSQPILLTTINEYTNGSTLPMIIATETVQTF